MAKKEDTESVKNDPPKKANKMQKMKDKHADKLKELNIRETSKIGENVINLERETTDQYCCFILIAVFLICIGLGAYGFSRGGTSSIAPYTLDGEQCGNSPGHKSYPYLYFTDIKSKKKGELFDEAVCVRKCPKKGDVYKMMPTSENKEKDGTSEYGTITAGLWCMPDPTDKSVGNNDIIKNFQKNLKQSDGGKALVAFLSAAPALVICMFTAGIFSIIYIYCLANFATMIAYIVIGLFELIFIGAILAGMSSGDEGGMVVSAVFGIFFILFNVMLYCKWDQIKMAIAVIDATAEFFVTTKRINFVSIGYFTVMAIWVIFWGACALAMLSGTKFEWDGKKTSTHQERHMSFKDDDEEKMVQYMLYYQYFALIWVTLFLNESNVFALMCSVSTFYFDSNSESTGEAQVMTSLRWTHVNHTGSIAMGSGIHTVIKLVFESLNSSADSLQEQGGAAACIAVCLKCCFRCVEDILEYLNKVAYAYMAITGDKYCTSAWNGFLLNIKHCSQFYIAIYLAGGFILFGTLVIIGLNLGVFFALYTAGPFGKGNNSMEARQVGVALYGIVFIITIVVANIFLGLFDEAVMSTLHCMAMDMELNDGRPKFGPPSFHEKIKEILGEEAWKEIEEERAVYYPQSYPPPQMMPVPGQQYMVQQPMPMMDQSGNPMMQQPMGYPQQPPMVDQYGNPMMQQPAMMQAPMGQPPMMMGVPQQQQQTVQTTTTVTTHQAINVQMQ